MLQFKLNALPHLQVLIKSTKYMEIGERVEFDVWLLGRTFTFLDLSLQEGFQLEQCSGSPQGRENDLPD